MGDNKPVENIPKNKEQLTIYRKARYARIIEALSAKGLSTNQGDIGALLYPPISQGAVSQWATGSTTPTPEYATQIAVKTGRAFEWIWTGRGRELPDNQPLTTDDLIIYFLDSLPQKDRERIIERVLNQNDS